MSMDLNAEIERAKYFDDMLNNLDKNRMLAILERIEFWREDNDCDISIESFIEQNLEAMGY
ncbi:MAG: hypothetical protein WC781_05725 [Candidatus Pacearchaeota archaeon]